jgi:putative transposase
LLKFAKDRHRWLTWLYEAKKRYNLTILNYTVTSNHIHLIVQDANGLNVIPRSIQLVAGRTAQEFNNRKKRKGAFWEDRYHATAIETGDHLLRCLVYVDLNMVRAGVVRHPAQWLHGGYNEIQQPRRKNILIDYDKLGRLSGFDSFDHFQTAHQRWVQSAVDNGQKKRESCWTNSIAIGRRSFVEDIKKQMRSLAVGRRIRKGKEGFELRESQTFYKPFFDPKKNDMGAENLLYWNK